MPTAAFATLGCKVNQYETQRILDSFEERGFRIVEFNRPADVYVINTCSVTMTAERKSRQMVRRLARQNQRAVVVMTGCFGEMTRITGEQMPEAHLLVPNERKLHTLDLLLERFPSLAPTSRDRAERARRAHTEGRTRCTIKVQDGCNVMCAFCSIPYTRSMMHSRPCEEVLEEVQRKADEGYREIVVTGVLVGWYGTDLPDQPDLAHLLRQIAAVPGIERVRLSSIEPRQVTESLLRAFSEEPRLCNHLHIPLQSGDSRVLAAMNRPYDRDFYLRLCERAYALIPDLAITADIMVGFPGETEDAFENTLDAARQVGFARAHIFRYSPRPNTPAAERGDTVPEETKSERAHLLAQVCVETQRNYIQRRIGQTYPVLVEGKNRDDGLLTGYTANYIRTAFAGSRDLIGTVVPIRLQSVAGEGAIGDLLSSEHASNLTIPLISGDAPVSRRSIAVLQNA